MESEVISATRYERHRCQTAYQVALGHAKCACSPEAGSVCLHVLGSGLGHLDGESVEKCSPASKVFVLDRPRLPNTSRSINVEAASGAALAMSKAHGGQPYAFGTMLPQANISNRSTHLLV